METAEKTTAVKKTLNIDLHPGAETLGGLLGLTEERSTAVGTEVGEIVKDTDGNQAAAIQQVLEKYENGELVLAIFSIFPLEEMNAMAGALGTENEDDDSPGMDD